MHVCIWCGCVCVHVCTHSDQVFLCSSRAVLHTGLSCLCLPHAGLKVCIHTHNKQYLRVIFMFREKPRLTWMTGRLCCGWQGRARQVHTSYALGCSLVLFRVEWGRGGLQHCSGGSPFCFYSQLHTSLPPSRTDGLLAPCLHHASQA